MAPVPTLRHDTRGAESETSGQDYELQHPGAVHRQRLSLTRVMAMGKMVPVRGRFLPENATGIGRMAIAPGRDGGRRCDRFHPWQGEGARQAPPGARFDTKVVKTTDRSLNCFNWSIIDLPD